MLALWKSVTVNGGNFVDLIKSYIWYLNQIVFDLWILNLCYAQNKMFWSPETNIYNLYFSMIILYYVGAII